LIGLGGDVYDLLPVPSYYGPDRIAVSARIGKETLRIQYYVVVRELIFEGEDGPDWKAMGCPNMKRVWTIKQPERSKIKSLK